MNDLKMGDKIRCCLSGMIFTVESVQEKKRMAIVRCDDNDEIVWNVSFDESMCEKVSNTEIEEVVTYRTYVTYRTKDGVTFNNKTEAEQHAKVLSLLEGLRKKNHYMDYNIAEWIVKEWMK